MIRNIPNRKIPIYTHSAKEIVRVLNNRPHLLLRVTIKGDFFPHRAVDPLIRIITSKDDSIESLFTEVASDNSEISGYLPIIVKSGTIQFGYEDEVWGTLPLNLDKTPITRLDRKKLTKDVVIVDEAFLKLR